MDQKEILQIIENFKQDDPLKYEEKYLNGDCYVFAHALAAKFTGTIYYLAIDNHFITKIDEDFYDIRGLVPKEEIYECYEWEAYNLFDPLDADRVKFYCIDNKIFFDL